MQEIKAYFNLFFRKGVLKEEYDCYYLQGSLIPGSQKMKIESFGLRSKLFAVTKGHCYQFLI